VGGGGIAGGEKTGYKDNHTHIFIVEVNKVLGVHLLHLTPEWLEQK
jgi:hypothetical protein